MDIVLHGVSAFAYWLGRAGLEDSARRLRVAPTAMRVSGKGAFGRASGGALPSAPNPVQPPASDALCPSPPCAVGDAGFDLLASLSHPVHVSVPRSQRSQQRGFVKHVRDKPFGDDHLVCVAPGVFAPSPELCFVQVAEHMPFHQTVKAGCALCSTFSIDPAEPFGLASVQPLTTLEKLRSFVESNPGARGRNKACQALPYVKERAASPAEIYQLMVLTLPTHRGGFGLRELEPNCKVSLGKRAAKMAGRSFVVPDLYSERCRVAIEYDADATHCSGRQLSRDATKRMALESMDVKVITVTTGQLASFERMRDVADEVARAMGTRVRISSASFESAQRLLGTTRKSFDGLFDAAWLEHRKRLGASAGPGVR